MQGSNDTMMRFLLYLAAGDCCWALYPKRNFKGRPMFLGGKIALRSSMKWGWLGQKVRSAKKLKSCTML